MLQALVVTTIVFIGDLYSDTKKQPYVYIIFFLLIAGIGYSLSSKAEGSEITGAHGFFSGNFIRRAEPDSQEVFIKNGDSTLFCRVFGQGDPIIVIHGGPGLSQDYLLPLMARLAKNHQVIFYDQRCCGASTGKIDSQSIQIQTYLDDLESIRKHFGYKKFSVLGHSWGGFLAMQYAIFYPDSIHKLVLLNSLPASSEEYALFGQEWQKRMAPYLDELNRIKTTPAFAQGDARTIEEYYRIIFERYCYDSEKAKLLNLLMTPEAFLNGSKVYEVFNQNLFTKTYNHHEQLKQINLPTLIIHGDVDPIPPQTAENIHTSIKDSKYILMQNCGHFPYVEAPEELFKHLNQFFN